MIKLTATIEAAEQFATDDAFVVREISRLCKAQGVPFSYEAIEDCYYMKVYAIMDKAKCSEFMKAYNLFLWLD